MAIILFFYSVRRTNEEHVTIGHDGKKTTDTLHFVQTVLFACFSVLSCDASLLFTYLIQYPSHTHTSRTKQKCPCPPFMALSIWICLHLHQTSDHHLIATKFCTYTLKIFHKCQTLKSLTNIQVL